MKTTIPELQNQATDAELAAAWAMEALRAGRYKLGAALSRIAVQAAAADARGPVMVPIVGATREEQARAGAQQDRHPEPWETMIRLYEDAVREQEQANIAAAQAEVTAAPTEVAGAAVTELFPAVKEPGARCAAMATFLDGVKSECRGGIYWTGGEGARWAHVDERVDQDHAAAPPYGHMFSTV